MASEPDNPRQPFDHHHYVPCLRWKLGERQALLRLTAETKDRVTPLIEVPEIGWDFQKKRNAKTLDEHLAPFAKRVRVKWETPLCFVDLKLLAPGARLADGTHPVDFVFGELRDHGCRGIPVTGPDRDPGYQEAVARTVSQDQRGVCLRMNLLDAARGNVVGTVDDLLRALRTKPVETDLVLDLGAPNFVPLDGFSKMLQSVVLGLPHLDEWRTFTVIGTSFPATMGELGRGAQLVDRHEWLLYRRLIGGLSAAGRRLPTFGDYAVAHPEVLLLDMRLVKPAASIRYAVDDAWYILKGLNVRDHHYAQYRTHCRTLISSPYFAGRGFSAGDAYIDDCANGVVTTGNLTTWRWVGTNHHISKVAEDIASLSGSQGTT